MNPLRFDVSSAQPRKEDVGTTQPRKEKDSRRFWILTISIAVLLAVIALVYLLTH
jgi:hypothetical protein